MTEEPQPVFSRWRALLWPVHRWELGKIIPMLVMFFFISLDYNILRCIKDSLIITAKGSGAEAIPYIKVWAMFPASILFTWLFLKLTKYLKRETVFYIIFSIFVGFFALFGFFFFPMREQFHLHSLADSLSKILPLGCQGLISMIRYWSFSIFYVMSELWGNIVLFVLTWGFVNQVTKFDEARRFYAIFGIGVNLSGIFSGELSIAIANFATEKGGSWETSLTYLMGLVTVAGFIAACTFFYLNRYIARHPQHFAEQHDPSSAPKDKPKMSFRKSISCILASKYMLCLMAIVLSYNVIINLVEVLWKHEAKQLYPDTQSYTIFMNQVTIYTGILATISASLISGNCIRRLGWTTSALVTPFVLLITSIGFFAFFFLKSSNVLVPALVGSFSPLALVVFFGTLQNCVSRAAKYSIFDETKEMAYIPLPPEEKIKGKAAIDGVFNRMGKSTGAFIYQGLFLTFTTISASAPYVAGILLFFLVVWTIAIFSLGSQINQLSLARQPEAAPS